MSDEKITLTIDDVEVSVPQGTLVVDAAKRIGNDIPVFCYHPKMEPVGMCRMCLVEIGMPVRDRETGEVVREEDGSVKLNFGRGLQTGCTVQARQDMVVRTGTEVVIEAREAVIEFLLTSHPLDCPVCDKGGECPLQNLTIAHGKGTSRMTYSDKLKMDKHVPLGELIFLDRERCIQCARCTRFQAELVDDPVIHFHNRGRRLEIVTMSDPGFDSYWSGNTTDICPVGALTTADFRFGARPWELNPAASISPHGPAGSNLTLSTRREAAAGGRMVVKRVMPRQHEMVNEIWISDRDRFVHHFAEASDRLTHPLIRQGEELVETSWDEALDYVAGKLQQHAEAAAGLSGDRLSNEDLFLFQKLFRQGLDNNNLDLANRRLGGGEVVAKVGIRHGEDYGNPQRWGEGDAILVAATDLHEEEPIWWLRVKQAVERGAVLVTMNTRPTRLDEYAAHALYYAPGESLDMAHQLLSAAKVEIEDLPKNDLVRAAQKLIGANNLIAFYGAEGLTYEESEALARILGNLLLVKDEEEGEGHAGRVNNGLIPVWPHNNTQGAWDVGIHPALGPGYQKLDEPGMGAAEIYAGVAGGEIEALYVLGADPVGDGLMPDRGRLNFLVVQELFMTETAAIADVVLPAQSWAEREGTFTSGERRVQRYYPAIQTPGAARPDWQILAQVGERVGMGKPFFSAGLVFRDLAKAVPQYKGMDYRTLGRVEEQWPDVGGEDLYYGGTSYDNRAGLGQQWPAAAEAESVEPFDIPDVDIDSPDGLALVRVAALYTPGTLIRRSAHLLRSRMARPLLWLHEADAASLGLSDGDCVAAPVNGRDVTVSVSTGGYARKGVALIRGVPYIPGTAVAQIEKVDEPDQ